MSIPMTSNAHPGNAIQDETSAYTQGPTFIPLTLAQVEAGLSAEMLELLRSCLVMGVLERELDKLIKEALSND